MQYLPLFLLLTALIQLGHAAPVLMISIDGQKWFSRS
jgi:hypothetical protein